MAVLSTDKLAVLIDADNARPAVATELMNEIGRYGTATVRRAYGDWTTSKLSGWKSHLHALALQPIQQFQFAAGKNSTDAALIIDAMDILHGGRVDGFCLVSSDCDFTRLATRIRESGLVVYGFGERQTLKPFVAACNKFVYTETLQVPADEEPPFGAGLEPLDPMVVAAVDASAGTDGWANLTEIATQIKKASPQFNPRKYGKAKLSTLLETLDFIELKRQPLGNGSTGTQTFVRLKDA